MGKVIDYLDRLKKKRDPEWLRIYATWATADKTAFRPLQATDPLAHEAARWMARGFDPTDRPVRASFRALGANSHIAIGVGEEESFRRALREIYGIDPDPSEP